MGRKQAAELGPVIKAKILPEMVMAQGAPGNDLGEAGARGVARPGMRKQHTSHKFFLHARLGIAYPFQGEGVDKANGKTVSEDILQLGSRKAGRLRRRRLANVDLLERTRKDTGSHILVEIHLRVHPQPLPSHAWS